MKKKVRKKGDLCLTCRIPVIELPRKSLLIPTTTFYYTHTLKCTFCKKIYVSDKYKRLSSQFPKPLKTNQASLF